MIDGNTGTFWSPSGSTGRVSVKWNSNTTVGAVVIRSTSGGGSVTGWRLVNNDNGAVLATGTSVGSRVTFTPVSLRKINFEITSASGTPRIAEFETYAGGAAPTSTPRPTSTTRPPTSTPRPTSTTRPPTSTPRPTATTARPTTTSGNNGTSPTAPWPTATGTEQLSGTRTISSNFNGGNVRYQLSGGSQNNNQPPLFILEDGAVMRNVIIGNRAADGIHCRASCTLINVWWEDVGEDAATMLTAAPASAVMTIDGGGARGAEDKTFQHNGDGTMIVRNFQAEDIGKLVRTCGNCSQSHQRDVVVDNVVVRDVRDAVVGINLNFGDTATIRRLTYFGAREPICQHWRGVPRGQSPRAIGDGPNSQCRYSASDITYR